MKCQICFQNFEITEILRLKKCNHDVCYKCFCIYLKKNLAQNINCPIPNCQFNVCDKNIREFSSNDQINKYDNLVLQKAFPNLQKCLSKNCPSYVDCPTTNVIFFCDYCKQPSCVACKKRHYTDEKCSDTRNEAFIEELANEAIKARKKEEFDEIDMADDLIPNPEYFDCSVCKCFIAPRKGWILRNCLHNFCKSCLSNTFQEYGFSNQLSCLDCRKILDQRESAKLISMEKMLQISTKEKRYRYFNCKGTDCQNFWKLNSNLKSYTCLSCKSINCIECNDIHPGMSCEAFSKTERYQNANKLLKDMKGVNCFNCGFAINKKGGCNALQCFICNNYTCYHTSKKSGRGGCGCTQTNPCVAGCDGCISE